MKGSLAKAARVFDALRIKLEAGAPVAVVAAEAAPVAVAEESSEEAEEAAASEPEVSAAENSAEPDTQS
jgi:large subunit ribosomal protein L10